MWPDLIQKAKDSSLDVIESYVFWNGHEPSPGKVAQIVQLWTKNNNNSRVGSDYN